VKYTVSRDACLDLALYPDKVRNALEPAWSRVREVLNKYVETDWRLEIHHQSLAYFDASIEGEGIDYIYVETVQKLINRDEQSLTYRIDKWYGRVVFPPEKAERRGQYSRITGYMKDLEEMSGKLRRIINEERDTP